MFVDVLVILAILNALFKGLKQGLIMALFNTVSLIIGLAAAVRLSTYVSPTLSQYLGPEGAKYLPLLSFVLVYLVAVIVIRLAGKLVQKSVETVQLGFVNRIGGVVLYLLLYLSLISIVIYYLQQVGIISANIMEHSRTYPIIAPFGPAVLDTLGKIIPIFKDMFNELNEIFDNLAPQMREPVL